MALILGTNGNDVLTGTEFDDEIQGLAGDDTLMGLGGNDTLMGKSGIDILIGGAGDNFISGGGGFEDTVDYTQSLGPVIVDLAVRLDPSLQSIIGSASNGFRGTDTLHHIERVIGSPFGDNITGDNNANFLNGSGGDDTIAGDGGDDALEGGKGNDILSGGAGDNFISGGDGGDTVDYSQSLGPVIVDFAVSFDTSLQSIVGFANNGFGGTDTLYHVERAIGSRFGDDITGDSNRNVLNGKGGNDTLAGERGNDVLEGEKGVDILSGGAGNNFISGGSGFEDMVDYSQSLGPVIVDLAVSFDPSLNSVIGFANNGFRGIDALHHIESVTGSRFGDCIMGDNNPNVLDGFGGADNIKAEAGDDIIILAEAWVSNAKSKLKIDGGVGDDTLKLTGFETTLDLKSIPNADLKGIEHIDLGTGGHNTVKLDVSSILHMSDTNTLFVEGDVSSFVIFHGSGWVDMDTGPTGYNQWTQGGVIVNIQDQIPSGNII